MKLWGKTLYRWSVNWPWKHLKAPESRYNQVTGFLYTNTLKHVCMLWQFHQLSHTFWRKHTRTCSLFYQHTNTVHTHAGSHTPRDNVYHTPFIYIICLTQPWFVRKTRLQGHKVRKSLRSDLKRSTHKVEMKKQKREGGEKEEWKQRAQKRKKEGERHRLYGILILRITANLTGRHENRAGAAAGDRMKQRNECGGLGYSTLPDRRNTHTHTHMPAKDMSTE